MDHTLGQILLYESAANRNLGFIEQIRLQSRIAAISAVISKNGKEALTNFKGYLLKLTKDYGKQDG
tara:strand:- start:738 stop:935 length:198 start_codon:yes stop_codon:yes gene_type:complete